MCWRIYYVKMSQYWMEWRNHWEKSSDINSQICSEMIVGSGLRFLGGKPVKSLADVYGKSDSSTWCINWLFIIEAVISNNRFKIHLPNTPEELKVLADSLYSVSSAMGVFYGVIGSLVVDMYNRKTIGCAKF